MKRTYHKRCQMAFQAKPIAFKPARLKGLSWKLILRAAIASQHRITIARPEESLRESNSK